MNKELNKAKQEEQQDKEKFLELGEEKFRKDCYKNLNSDNKITEDILGYMPKNFAKEAFGIKIDL